MRAASTAEMDSRRFSADDGRAGRGSADEARRNGRDGAATDARRRFGAGAAEREGPSPKVDWRRAGRWGCMPPRDALLSTELLRARLGSSLARCAYLRVFIVSSTEFIDGATQATTTSRTCEDSSDDFRIRVSLESLNFGRGAKGHERALMQFARARRLLLMWAPSAKRNPLLPVAEARSEPAKSTNVNARSPILICNTAWDRDDASFAPVASVFRFSLPLDKSSRTLAAVVQGASSKLRARTTPRRSSSQTLRGFDRSAPNKSKTRSLYTSK